MDLFATELGHLQLPAAAEKLAAAAAAAQEAAMQLFHEQLLGRRDSPILEAQLRAALAKELGARETANTAGARACAAGGGACGGSRVP